MPYFLRKGVIARAVFGSVVFLGLLGCVSQNESNVQADMLFGSQTPSHQNPKLEGLFWGEHSSDGSVWVVRFGSGGNFLYVPPGTVRLEPKSNSEGELLYESQTESDGIVYSILVSPETESLNARVWTGRAGSAKDYKSVKFIRIDAGLSGSNFSSGFYSNLRVNDESGDLNGMELLIVSSGDNVFGSILLSESGLTPRPFSGTVKDGKALLTVQFGRDLRKVEISQNGTKSLSVRTFFEDGVQEYERATFQQKFNLKEFMKSGHISK